MVRLPPYGLGLPRKTKSSSDLPKVKPLSDEWAILKFMSRWTREDLRCAIGKDVDLAKILVEYQGNPFAKLLIWAARRNGGLSPVLSPDNVLSWLAERRPDLYAEVVSSESGVRWLVGNFEDLRQFFNI